MGHIQKHETAASLAHPGKCHDCGYNGQDRDFYVDTGICTEWDGQIIICSACMLNLIIKTYGFDPFKEVDLIRTANYDRNLQLEKDSKDLANLRQGLAVLGMNVTSVLRLANFMEEENNGSTGSEQPVSTDSGTVNDDSTHDESIAEVESDGHSDISIDPGNSSTGTSDRKSDKPARTKLTLS